MSRVPCRIPMRLRYGPRVGIVSSRQSTTAELRLVDVLLEWTGYPSPPPAVSLRRRWNRTVEAPAMHVDGLSPYRTSGRAEKRRLRNSLAIPRVRELAHTTRLQQTRSLTSFPR